MLSKRKCQTPEINQTQVQEEEVLSNHAYYYDRKKKVLSM